MAVTLGRPASAALSHRFDVDHFYRMVNVGILSAKDQVDLIDGLVVDMPAIRSEHGGMAIHFTSLFAGTVADCKVQLRVHGSLWLGRHSEPQPNIGLLRRRADFYRSGRPTAADVLLLVEVADTLLACDRGLKVSLYARHHVPGYAWRTSSGGCLRSASSPARRVMRSGGVTAGGMTAALVPTLTIDVSAPLWRSWLLGISGTVSVDVCGHR